MTQSVPDSATVRQANRLFHTMRHALIDRKLCKETKQGLHEVQWLGWMPWFDRRAFAFIMDTTNLPVAIEKVTHPNVIHQVSTALGGRPVQITNHRGVLWAIGMDVPPLEEQQQPLPARVDLDLSARPPGEYMLGLGVSPQGPVWLSLHEACHVIIGGSSDSGKSATLRSILFQLMLMPEPVEVVLTDMEGRTFSAFAGLPRVKFPVAQDVESATKLTDWLMDEMDRRGALFDANPYHPENLVEHHDTIRHACGGRLPDKYRLPWIVAVFDEFTALLDTAGRRSDFYHHIGQLAMRSRKYGITLVYAGQDFKSDLIDTRITNQVRTRIAHQCENRWQSENIVRVAGAEQITIKGRALARVNKALYPIQGYWVPKPWVLLLGRHLTHRRSMQEPRLINNQPDQPAPTSTSMTDLQRQIVHFASKELGGQFTVTRLYDKFRGQISKESLLQLASDWEACGWLTPLQRRSNPRRVTPELLTTAGIFSSANSANSANSKDSTFSQNDPKTEYAEYAELDE